MTKMKKQKSGRCKFFQTLADAFSRKKKSTSCEDTGTPEPPFASSHDVPTAKPPATEKDPKMAPASPQEKNRAAVKAHQKPPREVPMKAPKAGVTDLDKVKRETGLINNEFAKDRLKIRPTKRVPTKYIDKLDNVKNDSLDLIPEDLVTIHAENNDESENLLNQRSKGSTTPDSDGRTTDSSINETELSSNSDSIEKSSKAALITTKQSNEKIEEKEKGFQHLPSERKLTRRLPRTGEADYRLDRSVDDVREAESVTGSVNQVGGSSIDFLAKDDGTKAVENIEMGGEAVNSDVKASGDLERGDGMLQTSMKGARRLPRTVLDIGESLVLPAESSATETDIKQNSDAEMSLLGRGLNAPEAEFRGSHRGSSRPVRTDSTARRGTDGVSEKTKKDIGSLDDIWTDSKQNEDLASSLKRRSQDSPVVHHDGVNLPEKSEETEPKHDAAVSVTPLKASRKGREGKLDGRQVASDAREKTGQGVEDENMNEFSKVFQRVRKSPSSDVVDNVAHESHVEASSDVQDDAQLASVGQDVLREENMKSAELTGIQKNVIHASSLGISRAESQKRFGIEPRSTNASTSHSRDPSTASDGKSPSKNPESEEKSTAPLPTSSENIAAIEDSGRASFRAADKGTVNESGNAFQKITAKQVLSNSVNEKRSKNSAQFLNPKDVDGAGAIASSSEKGLAESGSLKAARNVSAPRSESRVDALGRNLGGSKRGIDSKPAENHSVSGEDEKPDPVVVESDKSSTDAANVDLPLNKHKSPPAPPSAKHSGKVQPKPAEKEGEVAWVGMARRMSRDFGDKMIQNIEAKNAEQKSGNEIDGDESLERGGVRASVRELVKKIQQKNNKS